MEFIWNQFINNLTLVKIFDIGIQRGDEILDTTELCPIHKTTMEPIQVDVRSGWLHQHRHFRQMPYEI